MHSYWQAQRKYFFARHAKDVIVLLRLRGGLHYPRQQNHLTAFSKMSRRNNQTELPVVMESLRGSLPSEVTIRAAFFCPFHFSCRLTLQKQMQGATTSIKQRCLCKKDDANLYYTANINHLFSVLKSSLCNHCVAKHIHPHQQFAGCR